MDKLSIRYEDLKSSYVFFPAACIHNREQRANTRESLDLNCDCILSFPSLLSFSRTHAHAYMHAYSNSAASAMPAVKIQDSGYVMQKS